ncbi:hypothetical protein TNCV_4038421 [Trichonephila clavipes]|nr:hypothetical protein TNCV_4038421 [Trichonephila clavipes]
MEVVAEVVKSRVQVMMPLKTRRVEEPMQVQSGYSKSSQWRDEEVSRGCQLTGVVNSPRVAIIATFKNTY